MMYPKLKTPKKVTEEWLKAAFAPLFDYLDREFPEDAGKILPYMMFYPNEDQLFYYRHCLTKDSIIFDHTGLLVQCGAEALKHDFGHQPGKKVLRPPFKEQFVHPNVTRWIGRKLNQKVQVKYGEDVTSFLQELWGPLVNYDFDNLEVRLPMRGANLSYCCLHLYPTGRPKKLAIQFVGDEIVEKRCTYEQYQEYERRQLELVCEGWHVITIIREILDHDLERFRNYLSKLI
jgi:hypothetical protein